MTATITRDELKQKMDRGEGFELVETLPRENYDQVHLPGAANLPPNRVGELAPKMLPDKNAEIIVYCASETLRESQP